MSADLIVNLCFHGVGTPRRALEPGEDLYWLATDQFYRILDAARELGFVRVSVDDGNISDVETILPALLERGMTAAFFVLAGRLGSGGSLAASDVAELRRCGMQVGSHGYEHVRWPGLGVAQLHKELVVARQIIADAAGGEVDSVACPLGGYDDDILTLLRDLEYRKVFTSARAAIADSAWCQPRFSLRATDNPQSVRRMSLLALAVKRSGVEIGST